MVQGAIFDEFRVGEDFSIFTGGDVSTQVESTNVSYEVLARKWRPQVFEEVVGQEHVTTTLVNAIRSGRLAHAYLFGGPRGVGKTSVARILAKALNCEQGSPGVPCNACRSCMEITQGASVDVQEIDGASNRGIDEIRELRENIRYMPSAAKYRITIIDEIHMLTLQAFNALLKTLEEPPPHVKFIFATTEAHKVPVTILSRCQRFDFKRIPTAPLVAHLERIAAAEAIQIARSGLELIAREAEGSMRDAESLLDQVISFAGDEMDDRHIRDILGVVDTDIVFAASGAIIENDPGRCLDIVARLYDHGNDLKEFYRALLEQFRRLMVCAVAPEAPLLDLNDDLRAEATEQSGAAGRERLQLILNFLIQREEALRFTSFPRLILEATMIQACHIGDVLSIGDILTRLEALEKRFPAGAALSSQPEVSLPTPPAAPNGAAPQPPETPLPGKEPEPQDSQDAPPSPVLTPERGWDAFLSFVSEKNRAMAQVLRDWEFVGRSDKKLEIRSPGQRFSGTYFQDDGRVEELSSLCTAFFGAPLKVRFLDPPSAPKSAIQESPAGGARSTPADPTPQVSGPVQELLRMFHGKVEGTARDAETQ